MNNLQKSGFVALIGRTNAGKSTFLNSLLEMKISIVSTKPQTTRRQILGIKTSTQGQIVFFDSPGIHIPHFELNKKMMNDVHSSMHDADLILYFVEMDNNKKDEFIYSLLKKTQKPVFLLINKIDKYNKGKALDKINYFKDDYNWSEIIPISALKPLNLDLVEKLIYQYLPPGEHHYPEDEYTVQTEKFYIAEMIREKILNFTRSELPFTTSVAVEELQKKENINYIRANIYVERRSQKKIVIGSKGSLIKKIGETARKDIEEYFAKKAFVELYVKIVPNWRNSNFILNEVLK